MELAAIHGVTVARVSIRNQRSRWGACSPRGVITLNWRLIQMLPSGRTTWSSRAMHVRQPNHSRKFWREVESVCARGATRSVLKKHGREIL
jgi:predicted metal-dependent hydrolase